MPPSSLSPADIQQHIYNSLIHARTPDVVLHVSGSWTARYKLHRIVLIQSVRPSPVSRPPTLTSLQGFFSSLFTAGFLESSDSSGLQHVNIVFDDRNITRPAFEICIARLYGGGPPLHVSPALIPITLHPLTPSFPGPAPPSDLPPGHHPATPSFFSPSSPLPSTFPSPLSLLKHSLTSSIPSVPIPSSITSDSRLASPLDIPTGQDPDAAVGLEHIAEILNPSDSPSPTDSRDVLADKLHDLDVHKEDPAESDSESEPTESPRFSHSFNYGAVSDKIGEAAACWLARWGPDMLLHEERTSRVRDLPFAPIPTPLTLSRRRADTLPSRPSIDESSPSPPHRAPLIWARGGLTSAWIRELVSSDALFVKGERERYDLARTIVELRRREEIDDEEETDWEIMFRDGIYYTNMHVDDVIAISQDISPTTGRPFVPMSVLQDAHWTQSLLRCRITAIPRSNSSPTSSPSPRDKELGLCVSTAEIISRLSNAPKQQSAANEKDKVYYPVAQDSSLRIGDSNGIEGASMDQLFDLPAPLADRQSPSRVATSETNFFGLKAERKTAVECVASDATGNARWSPYPPCRFAVEFWDIDSLKEKSRLHSHTIWYAGNLFNVYVQVVRKKGIQLGIYLHRQSSIDPIPAPSTPVQTGARGERNHNRVPSLPHQILSSVSSPTVRHSPSMQPVRSTTPSSLPSASSNLHTNYQSTGNAIPATAPPVSPPQPYRDPRSSVSAYFSVSCTSTTGSSITRFTSVPDVFSVSQSWGWKSSSLRSEDMCEVGADGQPVKSPVPAPKELSLRATVVLGVV
ncbi:hypothetical protein JVT61DRAFT_9294 [Boletus reticuloceps]|uniref:BTB domain-containing protein n=1 Tax=Boletus reticuloceps TaxID=495285 RepID=A0A8I2YGH4_9AGAM|nr:hypothetical protein JVT61DRAFT_9294 [Boletus reticuloceps]